MIRSVRAADCNQIATIESQTFDTALSHFSLLALLVNPVFCGFVDHLNEKEGIFYHPPVLAGYLLANVIANEAEILSIAVLADHRNFGKGTALLRHFLNFIATKNVKTVVLEVAADNKVALNLYRNLGFNEFGCRFAYYKRSNGYCDAISMKLHV